MAAAGLERSLQITQLTHPACGSGSTRPYSATCNPVQAKRGVFACVYGFRVPGRGLPFGPYSPKYGSDEATFAATGSGRISNASTSAIAWPVPAGQ